MDFNSIIQLVGSLGFPIACCFAMFYYINKTQTKFDETLDKNNIILTELTLLIKQLTDKK